MVRPVLPACLLVVLAACSAPNAPDKEQPPEPQASEPQASVSPSSSTPVARVRPSPRGPDDATEATPPGAPIDRPASGATMADAAR